MEGKDSKSTAMPTKVEVERISFVGDQDAQILARLGHQQQLERNFSPIAMLALSASLMATWEAICATMAAGLVAGGPVSVVYDYILAFIGTMATALSISEAASMYPTAGGQYHFVAELAPKRARAILSWFVGWLSVLGWQSFAASAPFLGGTMIQGLLVLNYPSYGYQRWHGTLLYWTILVVSAVINIYGHKVLPWVENLSLVLHVALFFVILIVVCVVSPEKNSAEFVFTDFTNNSGWASSGVAWSIGMLSSCYVLTGYDGAIHMSEEMHNPASALPKVIVGTIVINGFLGFAIVIAVLFCMGDPASALDTATGYPIIQIFYNITRSNSAASAMASTLIVMAVLATIPLLASAARTLFAFARDGGMPYSAFLSKVESKRQIPTVAILVTTFFLMLLSLLNIASTTAFNAILSLAIVSLYITYLMPVVLILYRRLVMPQQLTYGPWTLGKFGVVTNIAAIVFTVYTIIFLLFPPSQPVTPVNMNYACLVLGAVLLYAAFYWVWKGRKTYDGPVFELQGTPDRSSVTY